jgi:hypothetical protein
MKMRAAIGLLGGIVLLASSAAHAFLGWPPLRGALVAASVPADLVAALGVGWIFGSTAMLTFGVLVTGLAIDVLRGGNPTLWPAAIVGIAYVLFGTVAFLARGRNPHFLLFVVTGLLVLPLAFAGRRRSAPPG